MATTLITSNAGDIERWAGEYDAVPVRDGDDLALAAAGEVTLDQERINWNTFHVERGDDTIVALRRRDDGPDTLAAVNREAFLERLDLPEADRRDVLSELGDKKTVTVTAAEDDLDVVDEAIAASAPDSVSNEPPERRDGLDERDVGKIVVTPSGDEVGLVTAVEGEDVYVDPHPGLAESALATLGWTGVDDEDARIDADLVDHVTIGDVRLAEDPEDERFEETTADR